VIYFDLKLSRRKSVILTVRQTRQVMKETWAAVGDRWQDEYLPLHFGGQAFSRYNYRPRSLNYKKKKRRLQARGTIQGGPETALVFTGLLKRSLLNHRQRQSAYPTRVTIHLVGPSYLAINYKPNRPNIGQEILTVNSSEMTDLMRHGKQVMTKAWERQSRINNRSE